MSHHVPQSPREYLSALLGLIPRALRAAWVGGVVFVLGLGATAAWTLSARRLYRSEAVLVYERGVHAGTVGGAMDGDSVKDVGTRVRDMLMSRQRLERAIKEMKLYPSVVEQRGVGEAIEEMRKHLNMPSREGFTFRLTFDADDRDAAQKVLDWLLKGLIAEDAQRRMKDSDDTKHFLDAELGHSDEELKKSEAALAGFLAQHPQLAAETGGNGATTGGLIRAADRERAPGASGDVAALELQAAQIEEALAEAGSRPAPVVAAPGGQAGDPSLTAARARAQAELQTAQRELADKQAHFTNEHPDVKALLRRVTTAEATLHRADTALDAHRASAPVAAATPTPPADDGSGSSRVAALRHALQAVHSQISAVKTRGAPRSAAVPHEVSSVVAIETEWTRLNRAVSEARAQQEQLQGRQFQAQLTATLIGGGQGGRLVIVDPPYKPMRPIAGGRIKLVIVGAVASLILSLIAIAILAAFDDRLYDPRDVQRIVKEGIIVVVPRVTGKSG